MWLSLAAIAIAVVMAAALFAPFRVEVSVVKERDDAAARVRAGVRWLGLSFPSPAQRSRARTSVSQPRSSRRSVQWKRIRAALASPGFVRRCVRLVADVGGLALPDRLQLRGRIGFEDPAETGMFLGWIYACRARRPTHDGWSIQLEPEFSEAIVEGRLRLWWSRSLFSVAWPLVTFLTSPVVWRAMWSYRAIRRS